MKEAGCNYEPGGESEWIGCGGQFRAMRVAMEDDEEPNDAARDPEWGLRFKSDEKA